MVLEGGHGNKYAFEGGIMQKNICSEGVAHKITCLQNVRFKDLLKGGKTGAGGI